ncbi:MAG TPA: hypothetical protein VIL49_11495 [Capillimicrobium sp.]|jgi:predicted small lipoprotein YifL
MTLRLAPVALACLVLAGCGQNSSSNPEEPGGSAASGTSPGLLPATDVARVQEAMESITSDCEGATEEDVDKLVGAFEDNGAEAIYEPGNANVGKSMTAVLEIKRDELAACGRDDLSAKLDRTLGAA